MTKSFGDWAAHFQTNDWTGTPDLDWSETPLLNRSERQLVVPSLRQFQLGESSEGRNLRALAAQFAAAHGVAHLAEATAFFIGEEQRHSALLAHFLRREGVPLLERDALDGAFRWLRKPAG